jgi:hypothetical protein
MHAVNVANDDKALLPVGFHILLRKSTYTIVDYPFKFREGCRDATVQSYRIDTYGIRWLARIESNCTGWCGHCSNMRIAGAERAWGENWLAHNLKHETEINQIIREAIFGTIKSIESDTISPVRFR